MPSLIFLDFDGVLNHPGYAGTVYEKPDDVDKWGIDHIVPAYAARLVEVLQRTGAAIVVSSSWRYIFDLEGFRRVLGAHGVARACIIGATRRDHKTGKDSRADQIRDWLQEHAPEAEYVILDDVDDELSTFGWRYIQTDMSVGLQDADVERAVAALQRTP